jgi:hypothetical protein
MKQKTNILVTVYAHQTGDWTHITSEESWLYVNIEQIASITGHNPKSILQWFTRNGTPTRIEYEAEKLLLVSLPDMFSYLQDHFHRPTKKAKIASKPIKK